MPVLNWALPMFHWETSAGKAIEYNELQLSIAKDVGDRAQEESACGNLGMAYRNLGDFGNALQYHEQHRATSAVT